MSDNYINKFLEKYAPTRYEGLRGDVLEVEVNTGFMAWVPGAPKFFQSKGDGPVEKMAFANAEQYLGAAGVDAEPRPVVQFTRYATHLNRDTPNWRDGEWTDTFSVMPGTADWDLFCEQFMEEGPMHNHMNRRTWAHVTYRPYPSFDEDDPQTHQKWNSRQNQEGKTIPKYLPIVQQVFESKEAAQAFVGESSPQSSAGANEGMTWREAIEKTVPPPDGWVGWSGMNEKDWVDTAETLCRELVNKEPVTLVGDWSETPIKLPHLMKLKEIVNNKNYLPV